MAKKLKAGDYCHEQHELILKLEGYLRGLVQEVLADEPNPEKVAFRAAVSLGALQDVENYNSDYRAWLESKRRS